MRWAGSMACLALPAYLIVSAYLPHVRFNHVYHTLIFLWLWSAGGNSRCVVPFESMGNWRLLSQCTFLCFKKAAPVFVPQNQERCARDGSLPVVTYSDTLASSTSIILVSVWAHGHKQSSPRSDRPCAQTYCYQSVEIKDIERQLIFFCHRLKMQVVV